MGLLNSFADTFVNEQVDINIIYETISIVQQNIFIKKIN